MVPWAHPSPLDQFNRFCIAHHCDKPTDHATRSVTIDRIYVRSTVMWPNNVYEACNLHTDHNEKTVWANIQPTTQLIAWVQVLRPTRHKIGHFGDIPQTNLFVGYGKTKPNTTKAHIHQSKEMYYNTKLTQKTRARFSCLLRHLAWKQRGSILVSVLHKSVIYLLT